MHPENYAVIMYVFFWIVRINGCIRRGLQPQRRGREWFFDVHVPPEFYDGAGKKLLHRYWMRMLIPFAVEIPLAVVIFVTGRFLFLNWLILGLCALIHINHTFSVNLAERQARPFAVPEAERPLTCMAVQLNPRRLRDYTNPKVEWSLALSCALAFVLLVRYYLAAPEQHSLAMVFGVPAVLLYLQLGMLFVKRLVLAWRAPVPQSQAAEYIEAREEARKYYLRVCDWNRAAIAAAILFWPIRLSVSRSGLGLLLGIWFAIWAMISIVSFVWVEIRRQQLATLAVRARPVKLPDLLDQSGIAKWPVCYQPSVPMLVLKGERGYSLNLANTLAHFGAAYLAGLIGLLVYLPRHR